MAVGSGGPKIPAPVLDERRFNGLGRRTWRVEHRTAAGWEVVGTYPNSTEAGAALDRHLAGGGGANYRLMSERPRSSFVVAILAVVVVLAFIVGLALLLTN